MEGKNYLLLCNPTPTDDGYCTYKTIGEINESNEVTNGNLILQTGISSVDNLNIQLLNLFKEKHFQDAIYFGTLEKPIILMSEDIKLIIFKIIKWRRCTGFLTVQTSSRGTKFLFYVYDKIMHSAVCFGTSCDIIKLNYVHKSFEKEIAELNKKIIDATSLVSFVNPTVPLITINYSRLQFGL